MRIWCDLMIQSQRHWLVFIPICARPTVHWHSTWRTHSNIPATITHTHRGVIRPDWQWTTIAINTHTDTFIVTLKTVGQLSSRIEYEIVPFLWNQILLLSIFDVCCCCCHSILLCVCVHFHLRIHLVELSEIRSSLLPYIIVQNYMIWRTGNSSTNSTQND